METCQNCNTPISQQNIAIHNAICSKYKSRSNQLDPMKHNLVEQNPMEQNPMEQNPMEQNPMEQNLVEQNSEQNSVGQNPVKLDSTNSVESSDLSDTFFRDTDLEITKQDESDTFICNCGNTILITNIEEHDLICPHKNNQSPLFNQCKMCHKSYEQIIGEHKLFCENIPHNEHEQIPEALSEYGPSFGLKSEMQLKQCPICRQIFHNMGELNEHVSNHTF